MLQQWQEKNMIQPISAVGEKNNFLFESFYIFILNISLLLSDLFFLWLW